MNFQRRKVAGMGVLRVGLWPIRSAVNAGVLGRFRGRATPTGEAYFPGNPRFWGLRKKQPSEM